MAIRPRPYGNPNAYRRPGLGLMLAPAWPAIRLLTLLLPRGRKRGDGGITIFQSYLVGDLYMALPVIARLARCMPVTVLCRPDCVRAVAAAGAESIPFANPFFVRPGFRSLLAGISAALALRGRTAGPVLDLEADPRTAFLLRLAGCAPVVGYHRRFAWFFDHLLPLPMAFHQGAKYDALAEAYLAAPERATHAPPIPPGKARGAPAAPEPAMHAPPIPSGLPAAPPSGPSLDLLLSVWTRKDTKNWPLESWDILVERLLAGGRRVTVIVPPDGDAAFAAFHSRWGGRVGFLAGDLSALEAAARGANGIIGTDNFLGHMGAWLGKPILWINGSSDPEHVAPRGSAVVQLDPMPCRPCRHRCVNPVYKRCLRELPPEEVSARAEAWLAALPPAE